MKTITETNQRTLGNGHAKSSHELREEIDHQREEIDETVDALRSRMSPGELLDQLMGMMRGGPGVFAKNFGRKVRDNPIPVALVGVGLTWLAASSDDESRPRRALPSGSDEYEYEYGYEAADVGDVGEEEGVASRMKDVTGKAKSAAGRLKSAGSNLGEKARGLGDKARDTRRRAQHRSGRALNRSKDATAQLWNRLQDQPLVLAAMGIAAGAALGGALPISRKEDQLMGRKADELKRRASRKAREQARAARETIGERIENVSERDTMHSRGG